MIVGIGCDIIENEITKILDWESNISTLNRIFSKRELDIYLPKRDNKFLRGRFAAKEAIVKCLGTGMRDGMSLSDIQILSSEKGQPVIELSGDIKIISDNMKINLWHITISHSDKFTMAFVVAECF